MGDLAGAPPRRLVGWEIVDELSPCEDELMVRKVRYDAFYGIHLDHYLRV